jgi:hypothetical protein
MSSKSIDNEVFNKLIEEPLRMYEHAISIWNRAGLNYVAISAEARDISTVMLQQSINLFTTLQKEGLTQTQQAIVYGYKQLINGQILFIRSSCEDIKTLESLQVKHSLLKDSIDLKDKAYAAFEETGVAQVQFMRGLRYSILGDKAMVAILFARICGRNGDIAGALFAYKQAEELLQNLLKLYEDDASELVDIKDKINLRVENRNKKIDTKDIAHIALEGCLLKFDDDFGDFENLDIYRRTWANYYSVKGSQSLIEAQSLISKRGSSPIILEMIDTAISSIYIGMEFFPDQLDYHQDLFNAYHMKGILFGCPIPKNANYYYFSCPLAIIRLIGGWYLSAGIRYKAMVCNICGKDILDCLHSPGEVVDGVETEFRKEGLSLEEISIVDVPRDPQCRISAIKIPESFFDGMIPLDKAKLEAGQLTCHLCDIEYSDLKKFPLLIDMDEDSSNSSRSRYLNILNLELPPS